MTDPILADLQKLLDAMDAEKATADAKTAEWTHRLYGAETREDFQREWETIRGTFALSDAMDIAEAYAPSDTPVEYSWTAVLRRVFAKWNATHG